MKIVDK